MIGRLVRRVLPHDLGLEREQLAYRLGEVAALAQRAARPTFSDLWDAEFRVFSQFGEDGILDYLCDCLGLVKPRAVEFGAGNFSECNTRFLAERRSASVVAVDAREDLSTSLASRDLYWKTSVWPVQSWITPETAPEILRRAREQMGGVDVLSLDIDGNDYWVADALDFGEITLVVVEYNALFGARRAVSVPREDSFDRMAAHHTGLYFGASIRAWLHLFESRGYVFLGTNRVGNNAFFCRRERAPSVSLSLPDTTDLERYVDWRLRDSRDAAGALTYLTGPDRLRAIEHLQLVDVATGDRLTVAGI